MSLTSNRRKLALLITTTVAIPVVPFIVIGELPGSRWLSSSDSNDALFALTGAALLTVDVLLPIPSSIIATLLGARLGWLQGWLAAWAGLSLGNAVGYGLGRCWPARWAPELGVAPALSGVLLTRPVPVLAEAMTFAAGAARVPLLTFLGAVLVGNAVYTLALAAAGAALLSDSGVIPGVFGVLAVMLGVYVLWRYLRRSAASAPSNENGGP